MVQYSTGEKTKQKFFQTSEQLFYEKGYNESKIRDISDAAKINKGSLYYYFDSKFMIGWKICELISNDIEIIKDTILGKNQEDVLLNYIVYIKILWKSLYQDPKLHRFYSEIMQVIKLSEDFDTTIHTFTEAITGTKLNQNELELISQVDIGIKAKLMSISVKNRNKYNWKIMSDFDIKTYLGFFNIDKNIILLTIEEAEKLLSSYEIDNSRFNIFIK